MTDWNRPIMTVPAHAMRTGKNIATVGSAEKNLNWQGQMNRWTKKGTLNMVWLLCVLCVLCGGLAILIAMSEMNDRGDK